MAVLSLETAPALADLPSFPTPECPANSSCAPSVPPTTPGTCGPGSGGSTCDGSGPATLASSTGVNVGAGNPINVINGNKYQREVDMAPLPGTLGLEIVRHYNSAHSRPGASTNLVGRGWKLSYETALYVTGRTLQVVQADGSRIIFSRDPRNPSLCASENPANGTIDIVRAARGDEYVWRWTNGRALNFDAKGRLTQILAPNGQFTSLQHDNAGLLVKVTDPQGRSLTLSYLDKASARAGDAFRGVQRIDSPVGTFRYHYGSPPPGADVDRKLLLANLVQVDMPTGRRTYHYEDARFPTLLTGISELATDAHGRLAWQRVSTYGYDADGKGNLSVRGRPATLVRDAQGGIVRPARLVAGTGVDQVTLDFGKAGQTTVTNSLGQPTVFRHAVIGGEYRLLEVRGPGCADCGPANVRYRYDALGRLAETLTLDARGFPTAGMRTEYDVHGRQVATSKVEYRNGVPGAPQWQARFEYAGRSPQPARVFRPSVVAGKEAVVTFTYADSGPAAGLPLTIREDGFAPSTDARTPAAAISRTVAYRYNAYGERMQTDGPLANGSGASPADSDITTTEFDPVTKLPVRVRHPGNRLEEILERDAALRPRVIRITDGPLVRTITLALNWRGQAERVEVSGTAPARYRYDVNGQPLDAGARTASATQPAGNAVDRDWLGRPVAWHAADGVVAARAGWGQPGTAAQASIVSIDAGDAHVERLIDDFGRVGAIRNPGQGWQLARHDPAGRIVDSVDARGARQWAQWDAAGRLLKLVHYAPGQAAAEQTLSYRYAGSLPVEQQVADADGSRRTRNEYDAQGRIVRQTLEIVPSARIAVALPQALTMRHEWRYDDRGRLIARTFTDGSGATFELQEDVDEQGRTVRIATRGALAGALGGGRIIAAAIGWTPLPAGPFAERIEHGDGSVDRFDIAPSATAPAGPGGPQADTGTAGASPSRQSPGQDADAAGLPATIATAAAELRLEWDADGRLARSTHAGGNTRYLYDANRQRIARIVTDAQGRAVTTLFFYRDKHLVAEADAEGRMQYAYAYLGWRPLAQLDLRPQSWWGDIKRWLFGAPVRHLHTDRAGRVVEMTQDGQSLWRDGDASAASPVHQPLRYVGQYHDDDSGLRYHGARYFDPASGRFLSPDPQGIADALSGVAAPLLLDLYVYAGGQPDEFFDPDGAARIRYFAITTTGENQTPLGTNQGFTQARWAFIIDNIQAGSALSALGQKRNEYAQNGTSLLVDMNGSFIEKGQSALTWSGGSDIGEMFTNNYGNNLISLPEFTINDMNDDDAAKLIASYIAADSKALFGNTCPARAPLLPQIKFAAGDANIDVTSAKANGANIQRILNCTRSQSAVYPVPYANDEERRRVEKLEAAAELNESPSPPAINKDCSKNGCPGMAVIVNGHTYHASYGRTQFVGETFLRALKSLIIDNSEVTAADKERIGITQDIIKRIQAALNRSVAIGNAKGFFSTYTKKFGSGLTAAQATAAWSSLTPAERQSFQTKSGLGQQEFVDMLTFKPSGAITEGEGRNAFMTEAIFSDPVLHDWLMSKFRSVDDYNYISRLFLRANLRRIENETAIGNQFTNNAKPGTDEWITRQRVIEENLAARVARMHNGGAYETVPGSKNFRSLGLYPDIAIIKRKCEKGLGVLCDINGGYVGSFLGTTGQRGDWRSLRCTDGLDRQLGLEMKALNLK